MSIWVNIRSIDGSQNTGFEKLCCQLASYEPVPDNSVFIYKGNPDAGVECYWKMLNGDEWGWQAKFFLSTPGDSQWAQMDSSVKKALAKHPDLTKYFICLPLDRADPRIDEREYFMDKWELHVMKWENWAKEDNRDVEFIYWGETELLERLSREEHRGRYLFWFKEQLFSNFWFKDRIIDTIENVGPRYSPEINVELPINSWFNCLGRTKEFNEKQLSLYLKLKKSDNLIQFGKEKIRSKDAFNELNRKLNFMMSILKTIESPKNSIDFDLINQLADESLELSEKCIRSLNDTKEQQADDNSNEIQSFGTELKQIKSNYQALKGTMRKIKEFAQSKCSILTNSPALLIYGEAGIGKTHLLCDIAKNRIKNEMPTILLLGGQFNNGEPWSQIITHLGLSCTRDEFLGALEAAAQLTGSRTLILIDAINEGFGTELWPNYLAGMLSTLSRYPWIGIAISIRDSYLDLIIPEQASSKLVYLRHIGFTSNEYKATETFFEYYDIKSPKMPLLNPEFSNPLFLKIFCKSLKNRNLSEIQPNIYGISSIFKYFLGSINEKLQPLLGFDPLSSPVVEAVNEIAKIMANKQSKWLPRLDAKELVNNILGCSTFENSLFYHLISEGILSEDIIWDDGNPEHIIRFTYERFTDHMIMEFLLKNNLNYDNPHESFTQDKPLGSFFKDKSSIYMNSGFIEALFILIPEQTEYELGELIPNLWNIPNIRNAFLKSLFWRELDTFNDKTRQCITEVIKYSDSLKKFLGCVLTLSLNVEHPYNAERLHNWLSEFKLAERDKVWSIFLYQQYGKKGSVDRLIDWALNYKNENNMDENALFLYGLVLGWFLTTSHRYVRDRSTKGLVNLFTNNISVLVQVIREFLNVNDIYILERLFAAAYGCSMRSDDLKEIAMLANETYNWIFATDEVIPNILLRDYARGIIEIALHYGLLTDIDLNKVRPPYKSQFPSEILEVDELKKYCECKECKGDKKIGCELIYESVMGFGDFSRYVLGTNFVNMGTNFGNFDWSSNRLNEPTKKEIFKEFVNSLTDRQNKSWEQYVDLRMNLDQYETSRRHWSSTLLLNEWKTKQKNFPNKLMGFSSFDIEINTDTYTEIYDILKEELENSVNNSENEFFKTIRTKKREIFKQIMPFLTNGLELDDSFDLSIAQRWIFNRVFDLGWTAKLFGDFDRNTTYNSPYFRDSKKPERVGKKYQWIAYHEFLARVSDNFEFVGGNWADDFDSEYQGPWQIYARDIDPSCLLKKTQMENWKPNTTNWWFTVTYENWEHKNDIEWIKSYEDLPDMIQLLELVNPEDNSKWLTLESNYTWEEPHPPEESRYDSPRGYIYYNIKSYIVKKSDINTLFDWTITQSYRNINRMPYPHELYNVFLGEYFWSPSFNYYEMDGWISDKDNLPTDVLMPSVHYNEENSGYDCSINDSFIIRVPIKEIIDDMKLHWKKEGHFFNENGLIAFDPSIDNKGTGALLIKREDFFKFLNDNDYEVMWLVTGEKFIRSNGPPKQRLEIMGAYKTHGNKIVGELKTKFEDWNAKKKDDR